MEVWRPASDQTPGVEEPTSARLVTNDQGMYVDANDAAAELLGVDRDQIVGQPAGTFTKPDARIEDAAGLWDLLTTSGRLHSLAVVSHPGGRDVRVEFITGETVKARVGMSPG